jgi:predicted double-glycine peptidase
MFTLPPSAPAEVRSVPQVPFFSQFTDITSPLWQKRSCGIASLSMIVNYYLPDATTPNKVLRETLAVPGAYINSIGWTYAGLIATGEKYGLQGVAYDLKDTKDALSKLSTSLHEGPVIASVHYKFDPKNPVPHLVVLDGIDDEYVYYNDPAESASNKKISIAKFSAAWKKRFIELRPTASPALAER